MEIKEIKQCFLFIPQHSAEVCPRFSREWPFTGKRCWVCPTSTFTACSSVVSPVQGKPSERRAELDALLPEYADPPETEGCHGPQALRGIQPWVSGGLPSREFRHPAAAIHASDEKPLDIATRCTSTLRVTGLR